jgi:hypothetical protein
MDSLTLDNPLVVVGLTIVGLLVLWLLVALALSGGSMQRVLLSKQAELRILRDPQLAAKVQALLTPPPPEPKKPVRPDGTPLRVLNLLQREGRLLDFLLENIQPYQDDQIGAAVRDIHDKCQKALREHLALEPVLPNQEGDAVTVPAGFDPAAIRLTGNVTGQPPFRGTLQHHGWRVTAIKINKPGEGVDELVIQPAEVELT